MADEAPAEPGAPPDFSTGFWKEFSLRHSRPAVYVAVLVAYALFILVLFATASSRDDHAWVNWLALGVLSAAVTVASAVHAARRSPGAKERAEYLRRAGEARLARRDGLLADCYRDGVQRSTAAPVLALLFLAPLYFAPGLTGLEPAPEQLIVGALMWLQALTSAAAAAAAGSWAAQRRAPRRPGAVEATAFLLITVVARGALTTAAELLASTVFWGHSGESFQGYHLAGIFLGADILACLVMWRLLFSSGANRFREAVLVPEEEPGLKDLAREDPASLGLDVSFWALFRWNLFRDPLFRAERRGFWTARRLVILWVGFAAALALPPLLSLGYMSPRLPSAGWFATVLSIPVQFIVQNLPFLIVATVVAATLATDRQNGTLESLMITPVAPLRLAASRLVGKCFHPILALVVLTVPAYLFSRWLFLGPSGKVPGISWVEFALARAVGSLHALFCVLAYGAVGLYFAARRRTLAAALPATYGVVVIFNFAIVVLVSACGIFARSRDAFADSMVSVLLTGLFLLAHGVLLRFFLMAAARELAVRSNE